MAIKQCKNPRCVSEYQDNEYGKGNRVMNEVSEGTARSRNVTHRCTVCGEER